MEHGGMWADVFIISPIVAYVTTSFDIKVTSWWNTAIVILSIVTTLAALKMYAAGGIKNPEAFTHHGKTTAVGWIHGFYAAAATWAILTFYLTPLSPSPSRSQILVISCLLSPFFFILGVAKFNWKWRFEKPAVIQVVTLSAITWIVAIVKIYHTT